VLIEARGVTKRYGALAAVDNLSFTVSEGETYGIAGPNGAGKTTLFDVISGFARATSGEVLVRGKEIQHLPAHRICHEGLARTYQLTAVFASQTVFANALVAASYGRPGLRRPWSFDAKDAARADWALQYVGLGDQLATPAGVLSVYDRKRLMIATALATEPSLLMLDEPAGGLSDEEAESLIGLIAEIKKLGVTVMVIEHVMHVLMRVSDRVLIMDSGAKLFEGTPREVQSDPEVIRIYLGSRKADIAHGTGTDSA
jgi:branched-chain amino acid transport system ATP-binding protein